MERRARIYTEGPSRRLWLAVCLCLAASFVQFAGPALHYWQVQGEDCCEGIHGHRRNAAGETALADNNTPRRPHHDANLCPVCQLLLRTRDVISADGISYVCAVVILDTVPERIAQDPSCAVLPILGARGPPRLT